MKHAARTAAGHQHTQGADGQASFAFLSSDNVYHATIASIFVGGPHAGDGWGKDGCVSEAALENIVEAYSNLSNVGVQTYAQLAGIQGFVEGLLNLARHVQAPKLKSSAVFLLSQLALAGPKTAAKIALLPGLTDVCVAALSSEDKTEAATLSTALLVNNVAALGGEHAITALTFNSELVRQLGAWLDSAHDAVTLQRLTGVFNHLSRSVESARALHAHGIMEALRRLIQRPSSIAGNAESREAYVGLANMAMANIAVRQEHHALDLDSTQTPALRSITGFLKLAIEGRHLNGIYFRVYDVLFALDSLCKCKERDLLGIECGLVDLAVQVTAEWTPGKYCSIFSDAKASTHPVLELSTDILMHLAHSDACRQRMVQLHLERHLERLLLTEEGMVREHVLKVLWVMRDKQELRQSVLRLTAAVSLMRDLSFKYSSPTPADSSVRYAKNALIRL